MDRRDFLKTGAIGASGFVTLGGAGSAIKLPAGRPQVAPPADMDAYVARMDQGMDAIEGWSPSREFHSSTGDGPAVDELARSSLRTLYLTAMFSDLPPESQRHSGVQERMFGAMPEMDRATAGMSAYLATRTPEDLARVQRLLRESVDPPLEAFAVLDHRAAALGVSPYRRMQTRLMVTEASWQLRNQTPSLVISRTLDKVERVVATRVSEEARLDWVTARAGEQLFWEQKGWGVQTPYRKGEAVPDSLKPYRPTRQQRIATGGKLMGIGLIVGGLAAAAAAAGAVPLVFVATAGAIMFVVGFIILLVGLVTPGESVSR